MCRLASAARRARRTPALPRRGLRVAVCVLHAETEALRTCGLPPHRSGTSGPAVSDHPRPGGRWNHQALLTEARLKTKREVEQQIARLAPKPDVRSIIRRVPDSSVTAPDLLIVDDRPSESHAPTPAAGTDENSRARDESTVSAHSGRGSTRGLESRPGTMRVCGSRRSVH